ncbi:Protein TraD [Castellaniella denitrificans]
MNNIHLSPEEPCFLDDDGPSNDLPPSPTRTNAWVLYGLRPGETVPEAIERKAREG